MVGEACPNLYEVKREIAVFLTHRSHFIGVNYLSGSFKILIDFGLKPVHFVTK